MFFGKVLLEILLLWLGAKAINWELREKHCRPVTAKFSLLLLAAILALVWIASGRIFY